MFIKLGCFIFKFFDVVEEREKKKQGTGGKNKESRGGSQSQ